MILSFHPCFNADHQIIQADRGLGAKDYSMINHAEAIILPQSCSHDLFMVCKSSTANLFPDYGARFEYPGKVGQSLLFEKIDLSHPATMRWGSVEEFKERFLIGSNERHLPLIIKSSAGHEGEGVYLIKKKEDVETALEKLGNMERSGSSGFVSQELIESEGNVVRTVIIGKKIISYWKRPENPGQIITTVSRGARIDRDWRGDLQEKARIEAERVSRRTGINLAAIDYIFAIKEADPQPLILDINYYFGRRGLGGSLKYYRMLFKAIREWLSEKGYNPESIREV